MEEENQTEEIVTFKSLVRTISTDQKENIFRSSGSQRCTLRSV